MDGAGGRPVGAGGGLEGVGGDDDGVCLAVAGAGTGAGGVASVAGRGTGSGAAVTGSGAGAGVKAAGSREAGRPPGREQARLWVSPDLPGVDLLRARYVHKTFLRHTHKTYVIAAISHGIEGFRHSGSDRYAGPGGLALINPDTPHTGFAKDPGGWRYGALYPAADLVAAIAAETTDLRGTPGFVSPVLDDVYSARLVHEVLRAADEGNALAADTLLRIVVTRLMRLNGGPLPQRPVRGAGARAAARARAVLLERMAEPPSLGALAEEVGTGPFALLRAFKEAYGLPPHAWLTDARVHAAKRLLDTGRTPAGVAAEVGFSDQPHLNRHFSRIVGVPPGAYRRERPAAARTYKTAGDPRP